MEPTLDSAARADRSSRTALAEPVHDLKRVAVGGKHWIEDLRDHTRFGNQRQPLVQAASVELEGRQLQALRQQDARR